MLHPLRRRLRLLARCVPGTERNECTLTRRAGTLTLRCGWLHDNGGKADVVTDKSPALAVFEASGYTFEALTARVNELLRTAGLARRPYHTSTIFRLVTGQSRQSRDEDAPLLIAQALSLKLGRLVHPAELWPDLDFSIFDLGFEFPRDLARTVEVTTALWEWSSMERRAFAHAAFVSGALALPAFRWLSYPDDRLAISRHATVTAQDLDTMRSFAATFRQLDAKHGGGQVIPLVTAYLAREVTPRLKSSRFASEQVGRDLYREAAVLTHMLAWLCHEVGRNGLAQRHYVQALRLAKAAGDRALGVFCLVAASQHAHLDDALDAALGATEGLASLDTPSPRLLAWANAILARAYAALGPSYRTEANQAIGKALTAFERTGEPTGEPAWIAYIDEASLAGEIGHCHHDLGEAKLAIRHAERVIVLRGDDRARSKAFAQILLARSHLLQGHVDLAAVLGSDVLDVVANLKSQQSRARFDALYAQLTPLRRNHTVRELEEKARSVLPAA